MSKELDDLATAETELASEIDLVLTEFQTLAAQLTAGPSPSAVEDIAQKITAQTARLKSALAGMSAPAPQPAPAPVTTPVAPVEPMAPSAGPATATVDNPNAPAR